MLKLVQGLILLILAFPSWAQGVLFRVDSLPTEGVLLNKGWRWHSGDNPDWARPDVVDSTWQTVNPALDIQELPQLKQERMGWLRLHVGVDSALTNKIVSMLVEQQVASQIYLNGRQIGGFGQVSADPNQVKAYNPSGADQTFGQTIHFQFDSGAHQVLAVRFALQPQVHYRRFWIRPNPFLLIRLFKSDQRNELRVESTGNFDLLFLDYIKVGLFVVLALLHLSFYITYPAHKVNIWFGLYCIVGATAYLSKPLTYQFIHSVPLRMYSAVWQLVLFLSAHLFFLGAVYSIFNKRVGILFYSAIVVFTIYTILFTLQVDMPVYLGIFLSVLMSDLETSRLLLLAARKREKVYWILTAGALCYIVFLVLYIAIPVLSDDNQIRIILTVVLFNLNTLSPPLSLTLFLASRFAQTNRSLAEKLLQVEALSAQTLAQEQEKQQLLATQNERLEQQVSRRTVELRQSLAELKSTQNQLIQREKMASLGELTAGIAHEIQNPLNFVNNISELSTDIIGELKEAFQGRQVDQIHELTEELNQNLVKINHHGRRASTIIRGMLAHSRGGSSEPRLTDLSKLAQEYLKLAYQGYRSHHPRFTCQLIVNLDARVGAVLVLPQELGRVLLNLYSNSFYAVEQKLLQSQAGQSVYQPTLWVTSSLINNWIEIRVEDNGTGIDEAIQAKIFQPFFTTKPTGQGTGLGLSLSYEIITKGHGGDLIVQSQPPQGTLFIIRLPYKTAQDHLGRFTG